MKRWISVDPGTRSGLAVWAGAVLEATAVVRPIGKLGRWATLGGEARGEAMAWNRVLGGADAVAVEGCGFGLPRGALASLSRKIGGLERSAELAGVRFVEVNVSEWRRVVAEAWGCSWPRDSEACKRLAQSLVLEHFGRQVSEDEADAVLVGHAALRMRLVDATQEAA